MKFSEVVEQASALLQRKGRITYRAFKREFTLDDDALEDLKFELIMGQELAHSNTLAAALVLAMWLYQLCRDGQRAKERAEAAITLATEQGIPFWLAAGNACRGWLLAEQGPGEEGLTQIHQGLAAFRTTGGEVHGRIHPLVMLAEVCGKVSQTEEGLSVVAEALAVVNSRDERWLEAELYRLRGELTLQKGARNWGLGAGPSSPQAPSGVVEEAEECFLKAIEIARKQQAKSLELRAVVSLSRLWQRQGKKEEARQLLAEIYGWFTEGFDTKDLQEAKALLDQLSEG